MFTSNPFADLIVFLPPYFMQVYIILMVIAVAAGTLFDMLHKNSVIFFAHQWKKSQSAATKQLSGMDNAMLVVRTLLKEVITSGEFCNPLRRISHLLMFYGFIIYLVTTIALVFVSTLSAIWPVLWNIGALMVLIGGFWFFFFIRVNVAKEGHSPFRLMRADLFIVSLLASVIFALLWEIVQAAGGLSVTKIIFSIYILFTTLLFLGVPWSKFAHMFYKPAAAFQRRVEETNGSSDLPTPSIRHDGR
jgi:hypothetical protein